MVAAKESSKRIREVVRVMGRPYGSELSWKHPYNGDTEYKKLWDDWRDSGFEGDEPIPKDDWAKQVQSSIDPDNKSEYSEVCPLCGSSIATWTHAYEKIKELCQQN